MIVHPARRMVRPLRIEYPGAVYHVMARGNQGRPIFKDDKDRKRFLETLEESCQKTGWEIAETDRKLNAKSRCHNSRTDPCDIREAWARKLTGRESDKSALSQWGLVRRRILLHRCYISSDPVASSRGHSSRWCSQADKSAQVAQ